MQNEVVPFTTQLSSQNVPAFGQCFLCSPSPSLSNSNVLFRGDRNLRQCDINPTVPLMRLKPPPTFIESFDFKKVPLVGDSYAVMIR